MAEASAAPKRLKFHFDHGLGDCVHFALLLQLYRTRGYHIQVHGERNKEFLWRVAGAEIIPLSDGPPHHPWTYPPQFGNLNEPDIKANKIAHNLNSRPLPPLGDKAELWSELARVQLSASPYISGAARAEAQAFLQGLPRPIILFHSHGSNWANQKSLTNDTCMDFLRDMLGRFPGSIITLDWDCRAPTLGHERVRGIKPSWGHIGIEQLSALCELSHLFIGVDSGPFHFAALTGIPAIGVFRYILPNHCCIPNPRAVCMVPRRHHQDWMPRQKEWNLVEYQGQEPTGVEIAQEAERMLAGNPRAELMPQDEVDRVAGRYLYKRVGYDQRPLELKSDGTIGEGASGRERYWVLRRMDGLPTITISGNGPPTCHLRENEQGAWHGRWQDHEQMPIELRPFSSITGHKLANHVDGYASELGFWVRPSEHREQDINVIRQVYLYDEYRTNCRPTKGPGEVVIDIGAHIGVFARVWHEKNPAAKIICVEACPENIPLLKANVRSFATVIHAACTYLSGPLALLNSVMPRGEATGGSIVVPASDSDGLTSALHPYWLDRRPLPKVTLEEIMRQAGVDHIDVLKLDCEGAEFSILENTPSLERISFICGEYHGQARWDSFRRERFPGWRYGHMFAAGDLGIFHYENPNIRSNGVSTGAAVNGN